MSQGSMDLPPELQALEAELTARAAQGALDPPAGLRGRVLDSLAGERRHEAVRSRWAFAFGLAALFLVLSNLALRAGQAGGTASWTTGDPAPVSAAAAAIQGLLPDLTDREALALAVLGRPITPGLPGAAWLPSPTGASSAQ